MRDYPTGTVTFLFTDIEGSTTLWEQYPAEMRAAMVSHDTLVEEAVAGAGGLVVRPRGEGDSRFAVFARADEAVRAAAGIQRALAGGSSALPVPLRVRIGLHTGSAEWRAGDYYGTAVNRCARIRGLAHGGQVLLSQATAELVRDSLEGGLALVDLGPVPLKGLARPETVYQLWLPDLPNTFPPLMPERRDRVQVPQPPTELIGRDVELREIESLLGQSKVRLVTLTGPGGTGKTRLSQAVGHSTAGAFPDGVFFVDLAPISDPTLVMTTIAHTLGIREGGGRPPFDNLQEFLAGRELLLILDNLEQIVAIAPDVARLLGVAPRVKILATSRIPLQLRGEREYPVPTLPVPPHDVLPTVDDLLSYEAVRLFVQQAQAVRPSFVLSADNAAAVAEICRRLDGLPLAIEIAAARVRMLPPGALLNRLDQSMKMLVGGAADLPSRQQTLRGTIDWSYQLLPPPEQLLFRQLGVFVGGFTLQNADAVCDPDGQRDVFAGIETLLRNNLLRQVEWGFDEPRFEMLQTIRDYALERMTLSGELDALRRAHAEHYALEAMSKWTRMFGAQSLEQLDYLEAEHDNYRAAIAWGVEAGHDPIIASQICIFHVWFWYRHGHFYEGREWSERVARATAGGDPLPRAMSQNASALMQMWQGDLEVANQNSQEAIGQFEALDFELGLMMSHLGHGIVLLNQGRDQEAYGHISQAAEMFNQAQDSWDQATALVHLANVSLGLGHFEQALNWLRMAQPLAEGEGDPWLLAFNLNNFGEVWRAQGDYEQARDYYVRADALFRQADAIGDQARLIHTMAYMALHDGDVARAEELFREGLVAFRKLGNKRGMAECLAGLAATGAAAGRAACAARLLGAAHAQMASSGAAWWPADRVEVDRTRQKLLAALGAIEFTRFSTEGEGIKLEKALDLAAETNGS